MKRSYVALALILGLLTGLLQSVGRTHEEVCAGPAGYEACYAPEELESDEAPAMPQAEVDVGVLLEALFDEAPQPADDEDGPALTYEACFGNDTVSAGADSQAAQAAVERTEAQADDEAQESVDPYAQYRRYTGYPRYVDGGQFGDNAAEQEDAATIDQRTAEILAEVGGNDSASSDIPLNQCEADDAAAADSHDTGDCDSSEFNCYEYNFAGKTIVDRQYAAYCRRQGGPVLDGADASVDAPTSPADEMAAQPYGEEAWYGSHEAAPGEADVAGLAEIADAPNADAPITADAPIADEGCHRYGYECYGYGSGEEPVAVRAELDAALEDAADSQDSIEMEAVVEDAEGDAVRELIDDVRHSAGRSQVLELNAENDGLGRSVHPNGGAALVVLPDTNWTRRLAQQVGRCIEAEARSWQMQAEDMASAVLRGAAAHTAQQPAADDSARADDISPAEAMPYRLDGDEIDDESGSDPAVESHAHESVGMAPGSGEVESQPTPDDDLNDVWPSYDPEANLGL